MEGRGRRSFAIRRMAEVILFFDAEVILFFMFGGVWIDFGL